MAVSENGMKCRCGKLATIHLSTETTLALSFCEACWKRAVLDWPKFRDSPHDSGGKR